MKAVFMGTPDFSVETLKEMLLAGYEVAAVVTQPDKPKGRGKELSMSPVKEFAIEKGLTVLQPLKARDEAFIAQIRQIAPDVIVVVAFGQILPDELLSMPKYGCVNVHASLLPKYRGASPIQWAVIDGENESGVTTMMMDTGVDTGDMLLQKSVPLSKKETGGSLFDKLSVTGAKLLVETLKGLEKGTIQKTPQEHAKATHTKKIEKSLGELDFHKPADELECLIRGLNPWPSAYTKLHGKTLKIWDADVVVGDFAEYEPGQVVFADKTGFTIKCGKNALAVKELQLEGKKRMDARAFLLGTRVETGECL